MLALQIITIVFLILSYIIMTSIMIIFERDKPRNLIIWSIVFLFTSVVGYCIYIFSRSIFYKKKKSLSIKQQEDEVYLNLIQNDIVNNDVSTNEELYQFNKMAYNAKLTVNNTYTIFDKYNELKADLLSEINEAKDYIIFEVTKVNKYDFSDILQALIERARGGVKIKFIYDSLISRKILKQMRDNNIKVHRFSKHNTIGRVYANKRNLISIDGRVCFICNLVVKNNQLIDKYDIADTFIKFSGDIVQEMNISAHQDAIFAGNKFIEFKNPEIEKTYNNSKIMYVANEYSKDIELLIINAICLAKESIQLQLEEFIPTESILSLLRFAINSNIEVRLMVPLKTNRHSKYFASRAYAKQLALIGANVYLYDGFIRFNAITIDSKYSLFGSFILDREHLSTGVQNIVIIEDKQAVDHFITKFDEDINNSYRISNAKYMLLREKFFKNFV